MPDSTEQTATPSATQNTTHRALFARCATLERGYNRDSLLLQMERRLGAAVAAATLVLSVRGAASTSCERAIAQHLEGATITRAETVPADAEPFYVPRAFCRVQMTMTPTSDSDIKAEVWLPAVGWNGKFQAVGNGDAAGVLSYDEMAAAVARGYATSSTDTGHVGNTLAFALGHREEYIDFGYRALHEMTVKAKAVIKTYYGEPARQAYWNGCSQGGRQGITEAARFPLDYDGIIAGAAALEHMQLHASRLALNVFAHRSGDSYIPPQKYPAIHRAALAACDTTDGLKDGLIADPTQCRFDPRVIECKSADGPACLTPAQVETARGMYELLEPGSELEWARLAGPEPLVNAVDPFKFVVFNDPAWDWHTFRLASDLPRALEADHGVINYTDPNLDAFFAHGGKLLMYHGWSDPQIPPHSSVAYFNAVLQAAGESARARSIELYMLPGVNHCSGGEGPDRFDSIGALEAWVAHGRAPARIVSTGGATDTPIRTRPICPYPERAVYNGDGSIDRAENFRCVG